MPAEFSIQRQVQFAETDMAGVMHFSNFFRLMEEVEHAFWRSIGLSVTIDEPNQSFSWPRVQAGCEYFAPVRFEDVLDLRLRLTEVGEKSLKFEIEFSNKGKRVALGSVTTVCCALRDNGFQSIPIPDRVRKLLESASTT